MSQAVRDMMRWWDMLIAAEDAMFVWMAIFCICCCLFLMLPLIRRSRQALEFSGQGSVVST